MTRYYRRAVTIVDADELAGAMTEQLASLFDEKPAGQGRGATRGAASGREGGAHAAAAGPMSWRCGDADCDRHQCSDRSAEEPDRRLQRAVARPRRGAVKALVSVPLFLEYEVVLTRRSTCRAWGWRWTKSPLPQLFRGLVEPVRLHYLWRPQLTDVADEMVLETAINGRATAIVTFNTRHFQAAARFGIEVIRPDEAVRRLT